MQSRRIFLKNSAALAGVTAISPSIMRAVSQAPNGMETETLLGHGWEIYRGTLGGPWEAWNLHGPDWKPVQLPHCFNAYDACDPDREAYRGQGWYRTRLNPQNPFANGRTLLHFGGAGQRTSLFVSDVLIGENIGGYNEFLFDITDAIREPDGSMRIAVLCDNSRDLQTIPSDISDFNLYGGIYRHLCLVYVPAISIELVHVRSHGTKDQPAQCNVEARLYNPASIREKLPIEITITAPSGAIVYRTRQTELPWQHKRQLASFQVDQPQLWSPTTPSLYTR